MFDNLTIRPWPDQRSLPDNEYWQIAREIKKQESIYPRHSREMIKSAVEMAFTQGGQRRDPHMIERYVAMYLTAVDKSSAESQAGKGSSQSSE